MASYKAAVTEILRPAKAKRNENKSQDDGELESSRAQSLSRNKKHIVWNPFSRTKTDSEPPRKSGTLFKSRRRRELKSKNTAVPVSEIKRVSTSVVASQAAPRTVEREQLAFAVITPYTEPPTPEDLFGCPTITDGDRVEMMTEFTSRTLFPAPPLSVVTVKTDTTVSDAFIGHIQEMSEPTLYEEDGGEEEDDEEEAFTHQNEDTVMNDGAVLIFDRTTKSSPEEPLSPQLQLSLKWIIRAIGAILAVVLVCWVALFVVGAFLSLGKSTLHVMAYVVSGIRSFLGGVRRLASRVTNQVLWCAVLTVWYVVAWQKLGANLTNADGFKFIFFRSPKTNRESVLLPHEMAESSKLDATPIVKDMMTKHRILIGRAQGEANPAAEVRQEHPDKQIQQQ